jgi:phasin family protein
MAQKPRASTPLPKVSATRVAAKVAKATPASAKPAVSETVVTSEASQQPKASAPASGPPALRVAVREPERVVPTAVEPAVSVNDAIITPRPEPVAAVAVEMVKPITTIKPAKPNSMIGMKTMTKSTEDFVAFGQANVEAFVKSGQIWAAGVQELMKLFAATTKVSFDESVSTFKAITSAKSVTEAVDLQSAFASSAVTKTLAESKKLIDASIKLTEQTLAPITARVTGAVETFGKTASI